MQPLTSSPLMVGLVEFTEPVESRIYLPYSLGLLQSYAQASQPGQYLFLPPIYRREALKTLRQKLSLAQVVGFSCYIWNIRRSLALAQSLKAHHPQLITILGGPQVPDSAEAFLREHPYVDVCVHGEGELSFAALLQSLSQQPEDFRQRWPQIPGISWLAPDGSFQTTPKGLRLKDLDQLPSPYLNGFFEPLLLEAPQQKWVAVWESNRGCPFSCSFCDWGSAIATKVNRFGLERLQAEIEWFARWKIDLIYCADANFGILPRDLELAQALVHTRQRTGYPRKVIIQLTKNQSERAFEAFKLLKSADLHLPATLSLQSVTPSVMQAIQRDNISLDAYRQLMRRFLEADIPTYTDMLVGLPGDTFESFLAGIEAVMDQGQHQEQRFWNVYLLPNAEMAQVAYRQKYALQTVMSPYLDPFMPAAEPLDGIQEAMEMIIATATLPTADWIRARVLAWWTQILYYGRLLQLPLLLVQHFSNLGHRDLLRAFLEDPLPPQTPILAYTRQFLAQRALEMTQGQPEYVLTPDASGQQVWLPTQSFVLQQFIHSPRLPEFYAECQQVIQQLLGRYQQSLPPKLLEEALLLVSLLFRKNMHERRPFELTLSYNLWACYQQIYKGFEPQLQPGLWQITQSPDGQGGFSLEEHAKPHANPSSLSKAQTHQIPL